MKQLHLPKVSVSVFQSVGTWEWLPFFSEIRIFCTILSFSICYLNSFELSNNNKC